MGADAIRGYLEVLAEHAVNKAFIPPHFLSIIELV